jgi:hypothetical protein
LRSGLKTRHSEAMEPLERYRTAHPNTIFETRPLLCGEGISRLVMMPLWYWHRLEVLLMVEDKTLEEITEFCHTLAQRAVADEGWEFDPAFREILMYYIYRHIQDYQCKRDNLANDNWEDCFKHLH